jgi:predicted PurR-regulated permease PerM
VIEVTSRNKGIAENGGVVNNVQSSAHSNSQHGEIAESRGHTSSDLQTSPEVGRPEAWPEFRAAAKQGTTVFLLVLASIALYLCYLIARPFLKAIFAAIVISIVFYPLHRIARLFISRPSAAAASSTILVLALLAVPAILVAVSVTREVHSAYEWLNDESAVSGGLNAYLIHQMERVLQIMNAYINISRFDLRETLLRWLGQVSGYLFALARSLVTNILSFALDLGIVFFSLFFFFREGAVIRQRLAAFIPLTPGQADKLLSGIHEAIIANVYGVLAVALAQGLLTGLALWLLGVPSPVLWGLVTGLASLIPLFGSGLVWGPASILLFASGHWGKALILFGCGVLVIAQVDVLVRPCVVSDRAKAHPLLVFFALLGGMKAFGILGLFVGPIVLSVTVAVLRMLSDEWQTRRDQTKVSLFVEV